MKKYTMVTGGAGYIGSHTVVELAKNGHVPVIVDDFRNSRPSVLDGIRNLIGDNFEMYEVDVCDKNALKEVFDAYDFYGIIHFAADKAVGESVTNPLAYFENNIGGLVNVLQLAVERKIENFVFSSSCTVYGEPENNPVVNESSPVQEPRSPYGRTKQMGEQILKDTVYAHPDLKVLILRYFNPVGAHSSAEIGELPFGKPSNLLPYVTQTGMGVLEKLTVFGNDYPTPDGSCIRDFIHVVDLANAHLRGLDWLKEQKGQTCEVVNVGTGKGTSVLEIIDAFEDISGQKLNWEFGPRREGDITCIYANVEKSAAVLGWKAELSATDAVRDAWRWEQKIRS